MVDKEVVEEEEESWSLAVAIDEAIGRFLDPTMDAEDIAKGKQLISWLHELRILKEGLDDDHNNELALQATCMTQQSRITQLQEANQAFNKHPIMAVRMSSPDIIPADSFDEAMCNKNLELADVSAEAARKKLLDRDWVKVRIIGVD